MHQGHVGVATLALTLTFNHGKARTFIYTVQLFFVCHKVTDFTHDTRKTKMTKAFLDVLEMSKREDVYMRDAAYMVAIEKVVRAMELRGWI